MRLPAESQNSVSSCKKQQTANSKGLLPKLQMLLLLVFALFMAHFLPIEGMEWPYRVVEGARELSDCEGLGFPNATRNECGFCTGGSTGLHRNYSMDCHGSCTSKKTLDCARICGGTAYVDECSGECIGGTTGRSEYDFSTFRDCRGYCSSSGGQFITDTCGVCHTGTSPFQDCTNQCRLPGQEDMMAKLLCGRCVGGTAGILESEVLDNCGNCRGDGMECPCNGTGKPDACGVCNGGGSSCMRVLSFTPRAIPVNTNANVEVEGAFRGRVKNLKCILLEILLNDELGNRTEFIGTGNGTHVRCLVKLSLGSYRVGVKIEVGDPQEMDYVEDNELLVYEEAEYSSMSPTKAVFDRDGSKELVVTFSGGKVPPLPLICIITGEGWPSKMRLATSEVNTLDTCVIPYPSTSMKLTVAQSFNGINAFKKSFTLKFYATPPEMRKYYIAEDGHAVVIVFDRPVNLCNLDQCSTILNSETLSRLGERASCKWATKQQLIITVQNPITVNPFRVTFKKGILKQDAQKYALPKNESLTIDAWYPQPVSSAQVAISGPSTVSNCGVFTLVGHFSSPKGDAEFYWTANRKDKRPLESEIANALLMIRTASLTLNSSLLEVDQEYIFILTAEHPVNEKYEARHVVSRKPYIGPLVTAFSNVMTQSSVTIDERISLQAEMTLPECSTGIENMYLMWSVNNPKVKFNFRSRSSQVYVIQPYSLPENTEVIFIANAYFSNMLNVTSSKVVIRIEPIKLRAAIKGTVKRIVGNKAGNLVLESENLNVGIPVVYQWKCYEQNFLVCYNYKKNSTEPLLVPRKLQTKPKLVISCESLKAGSILTFELRVFNANNRFHSQTASVMVQVENKNIPQVVIDSVIADSSNPIQRHPTTGAYSIPAGLPVTVYATVSTVKSNLKSVKWEVKGYSSSFTYTTMNGKTVLSLEEGFLVGHGIYLIGLSACDGKGCGIANLTIHAVPGIALCKLETQPYVEYEMIKPFVSGCSIPPGRQPVTYQIYLHSIESVFPITAPQTPTVFNIFGPPQQTANGTQLSVQVCDKHLLCILFPGSNVKVSSSESKEEDRAKLIRKAEHSLQIDDPFTALSLFLIAGFDREIQLSETETENMLNAGAKATYNRYISAGQLSLIYSAMVPLIRKDSDKIKIKALDIIKRGTKLAFAHKIKIPSAVLSQGHSNAAEALQCRNAGSPVSKAVKTTLEHFVEKISASVPLGSRVLLSSKYPGYPSSLIFRQLLDPSPIYIKALSSEGMVEGSVRFEDAIRDKVRKRKCDKKKCADGVAVALTLYPASAPYPSTDKRTSPVLDITLRDPDGGKLLSISDVPNAVRLALTHSGNYSDGVSKRLLYKCSYWDARKSEWRSEGLVTFGVDGNVMRCWSSHLTSFAVLEVYDGLSTGSIVGIVVTVLMGVFIIMMFAFFFFRKKQAANARISNQALQTNRQSEKLQSMNGSTVQVKTVTP